MNRYTLRKSFLKAWSEPPKAWHLPVVLVGGVICFLVFSYLDLGTRRHTRRGDATVRRMYQHINLGATRQEVLNAFRTDKQFGSVLDTNTPGVWTFFPYGTRTSRSWLLLVEFRNNHVSGVKVRNTDGVNPRSAPIDKTSDASR